MTDVRALLRSRATIAWLVLVVATVVSWALGTDHGFVDDARAASVAIIVVVFVKIRLVGLYFMELRDAPVALRGIFEAYCLVFCALLLVVLLVA